MVRFLFILFFFASISVYSQESISEKKQHIDEYLSPIKATFYSAILPGLGQLYNRDYIRFVALYVLATVPVYYYINRSTEYNSFRDAYKRRLAGFTDDKFYDLNGDGVVFGSPDITNDTLLYAQRILKEEMDLALTIGIVLYIANIIDATVRAHLKNFNLDQDLSFNFYTKKNNVFGGYENGICLNLRF